MGANQDSNNLFEVSIGNFTNLGELLLAAACALGAAIGWFFERRDKKRQLKDASKQEKLLIKTQKQMIKDLKDLKKQFSAAKKDPTPLSLNFIYRCIKELKRQQKELESELVELRQRLKRLQVDLEKIYQEHKVDSKNVPGAEIEAAMYKAQIDEIQGKLDDIRSSIVVAESVSQQFEARTFDALAAKSGFQTLLDDLRQRRNLVGASVARFVARQSISARAQRTATAERAAIARAEELEKAKAKAENAHLKQRTIDPMD